MASPLKSFRVIIADKHPIFRDAIKTLLTRESGAHVVGEAGSCREALLLIEEREPDILLVDLVTAKASSAETINSLSKLSGTVKKILLNDAMSEEEIPEISQLDAQGLISKTSASGVLFAGIKAVMAGKYWIGRKAASRPNVRLQRYKKSVKSSDRTNYGLTPREMDIIRAVVSGYTNKETAKKLAISEQTVKHHITNIFEKLGVYNRLELTLFVFHHGLMEN
jgi:two-component system nitrate/nitrite response regulator NarL